VHSRHASYYARLAEQAEPELDRSRQADWIERLAVEQAEIRAALEWLVARGEVQDALRLAGVMSRFWEIRGHLLEGRARLGELLTLPAASAHTVARARALDGAAVLAMYQFDFAAARPLFRESLALYRQHRHLRGVAWVLIHLGWMCHDCGRFRAARRFLNEALAVCDQVDDRRGVARCLTILGTMAEAELDLDTARSELERSVALNRGVGDRWGTAWALDNLGRTLLAQAEFQQADVCPAQELLEEAVAIWRELGERRHLAYSTSELGACAAQRGRGDLARTQFAEALTMFTDLQDTGGQVNVLWNCVRLLTSEGQYLQSAGLLGAIFGYERALGKKIFCCAVLGQHHLESLHRRANTDLVAMAFAQGGTLSFDDAVAHARQWLSRPTGPEARSDQADDPTHCATRQPG
jgi:tetratricopeptide (TPR) repeat protein